MTPQSQIEQLAPTLFTIILGLILINLLIYVAHLKTKVTPISKQMCLYWSVQLFMFLIVPLFGDGNLLMAIPFSFNFVTVAIVYQALFASLHPVIPFKKFTYVFAACWLLSIGAEVLFQDFTFTTLPVALSISIPMVYLVYLIWFSKATELQTIYHRIFSFILITAIIHAFNFSFFRNDSANFLWGMTLHILIISATSITLSNFHTYLMERSEKQRLTELVNKKTLALNAKYKQMESLAAEKARLFRIVIHDLSNPITSLINYLAFLKRPELDTEQKNKVVNQAYEISNGMVNIINQVRMLEGSKSGKIDLSKEVINLEEAFNIVDLIFRSQYDRKGVVLEIDSPKEEILFHGNKDLFIHTVLNNLISNSLKFSLPGSVVKLTYNIIGDRLQIMVIDQGKGIRHEQLSSIFSMDKPTTSQGTAGEQGTGFGMPLVKSYIDEVDGLIRIQSKSIEEDEQNHGTRVELLFGIHKPGSDQQLSPPFS